MDNINSVSCCVVILVRLCVDTVYVVWVLLLTHRFLAVQYTEGDINRWHWLVTC